MRKIIHIDMDCFYAAIEMRDDPSLRNVPIAVGGSADRRGVISTANYEARRYGVHSAMSTAVALRLCPHLKVVPGRMALYKETSVHIRKIFARYTDLIEPLSLDEAYLDVTDCQQLHGSATLIAQEIRQQIFDELQLTASAGIAPIKFLAKIASDMNKPNGQFVIKPQEMAAFVSTLSLRKIPGVGKVTAQKLADMGLHTCADVQKYDAVALIKSMGKFGQALWERCHAIDERPINPDRLRKSVGVERTLAEDIHQWEECLPLLDKLYDELQLRLSKVKPDLRIARQGVKFKFGDFQQTTQEHVYPILDKQDLVQMAKQVWENRREGRGVRLVGLHVTLQSPQIERQLLLSFIL
ncbi:MULTISPECIES: DNA polymerase IV [Providencia]|uniref:DNA polymerase IV n=1 Tax=Providencia TaxID=586 RepID=UPI000838F576|nr:MULTISPECIES: DNA polymerase IV [Providencia]MBP6121925.1 DNA polymerase IV [Providencia sp.]NIH21585.1 DNA polymerase IV [Providencia heimbachae]